MKSLIRPSSSLVSAFCFLVCLAATAGHSSAQVVVGQPVKLDMKTIDGKTITTDSLKGKVVLLDFWATWCGPCMNEVPHMKQVHESFGKKGLEIIGISLDRSVGEMKPVIQQQGMGWKHVHDAGGKLSGQFGVEGIPNVFLISPDGVVRWNGHPANLDKALADVMGKYPPELVDAKVMKAAKASLVEAEKKADAGDAPAALRLLATIPPEVSSDAEFTTAADAVRTKLESAGREQISSAETLAGVGKHADAAKQLREVSLAMTGTPVGDEAQQKLEAIKDKPEVKKILDAAAKEAPASAALAAAKKLQDAKQHEAAYPKLKQVVETYPGTASGDEAAKLVKQYESDAAFMKRLTNNQNAGKAKSAISIARSYATAGRTDQARKKYEQIVKDYPGTEHAKLAQAELAKLK